MSKLAYKVNFLDAPSQDGEADRLFFFDEAAVLTVQAGHAPLISILNDGELSIINGDEVKKVSYKSGMVRVDYTQCVVTILS
jgi:F0F1-type ATP synthase epsilon subunit